MEIGIISLFPEMFSALNCGITGRAIKDKLINLNYWNPRDFTKDKHHIHAHGYLKCLEYLLTIYDKSMTTPGGFGRQVQWRNEKLERQKVAS